MRASLTSTILNLAADRFEIGSWLWNNGSRPDEDTDRDLFLAICGAAAELEKRDHAYDALVAVQRHVGQPLGPWNNASGRTLAEVIAALRDTAAAGRAQVAA